MIHPNPQSDPAQDSPTGLSHRRQTGGGLLAVVTVLGVVLVLVQGSVYFRAKGSAEFVGSEKTKILAQQMAEAGVEDNVADLGSRKFKITSTMVNYSTFYHKTLGEGTYSSQITTVGMGSVADTVDLRSTGAMGKGSQTVLTRLRLKKFLDTTLTPIAVIKPDTVKTYGSHTVPETTITVKPPMNPAAMPPVNSTPAFTACIASAGTKCNVCHVPGGFVAGATVLNINKATIGAIHGGHVGDYVTTDGTCDLYKSVTVSTITSATVTDSIMTIVDKTIYDTTVAVDTAVKVQFLSWK